MKASWVWRREGANESASILPLITFTDRTKTQSMRWWMGDEKATGFNKS